jgi:hypothetical protein
VRLRGWRFPPVEASAMSNPSRIVLRPNHGLTTEQARDARARAWAYVFSCFNRRAKQEGSPTLATLDDTRGESKNGSRTKPILPR